MIAAPDMIVEKVIWRWPMSKFHLWESVLVVPLFKFTAWIARKSYFWKYVPIMVLFLAFGYYRIALWYFIFDL